MAKVAEVASVFCTTPRAAMRANGAAAAGGGLGGPSAVVPHPPLPWRQILIRVYGKSFGG